MTTPYSSVKTIRHIPRLPLEGHLDLTYRCNNTCRHCWLWLAQNASEESNELTFDEIRRIADEARSLGTRLWNISGGEPMLREDFIDIFDYLTRKEARYTINTNGTLITPEVARRLKLKGSKLIALYGATAETYDRVTRHPGGFEMAMRGFRYMQEAGAGFTVQLIPMSENWHEWEAMLELARTLSPRWRVGAPWLYKTACGSPARNAEIENQRLDPRDVIELDRPEPGHPERMEVLWKDEDPAIPTQTFGLHPQPADASDDRLFASCIAIRRDFHIDPYGQMSFCYFIKDPSMRYDLRQGTFRQAWEEFIPSLADKVRGGQEWRENCGSCDKRDDCRWCAVYAYLETGRYSARLPYLCAVAEEAQAYNADWLVRHRRYFRIAGITVRLESDLDFELVRFKEELMAFAVDGPGDDNVTLRHLFELPHLDGKDLGKELYRKAPWAISRHANGAWIYRGILPEKSDQAVHYGIEDPELERQYAEHYLAAISGHAPESHAEEYHRVAVFSADHRHAKIYNPRRELDAIHKNGWSSLSLFPTDQIWLAPLLAYRNAVLLHSAAAIVNGQGLLFVGHSSAGKSTTMEMLKAARGANLQVEILCDDRNVVRWWETDPAGWRVHGTWSHGTTADVSPASAPLRAILFLQQAGTNEIVPISDRKEIWRRLLATLIRPAVTADWWRKELDVLERIVASVRCYWMMFDKSGAIVGDLDELSREC